MSEKASSEEMKQFLGQIAELDKLADEDTSQFTEWELNYIDEQAERAEEFGEKIYVSAKQVETLDKIYRKVILGEKPPAKARKRNRAKSKK